MLAKVLLTMCPENLSQYDQGILVREADRVLATTADLKMRILEHDMDVRVGLAQPEDLDIAMAFEGWLSAISNSNKQGLDAALLAVLHIGEANKELEDV